MSQTWDSIIYLCHTNVAHKVEKHLLKSKGHLKPTLQASTLCIFHKCAIFFFYFHFHAINKIDVGEALKNMKYEKAVRPDDIPIKK